MLVNQQLKSTTPVSRIVQSSTASAPLTSLSKFLISVICQYHPPNAKPDGSQRSVIAQTAWQLLSQLAILEQNINLAA